MTAGAVGQPITIKAQVPESLGAERVVVAYRPEGATDFLTREMDPVKDSDWYQAEIPPEATSGASVAYYILAQNADGQPLAQNGTVAEPHIVNLGGKGAGGEGAGGASPEGETAEEGEEGGEEGQAPLFWVALAAGSGFGYHSGTPEANHTDDAGKSLKSSGVAWSRLLQIAPELGFFVSDSLVLSLQGRIQIVTGASEVNGSALNPPACKGGTCQPSQLRDGCVGQGDVVCWRAQEGHAFPLAGRRRRSDSPRGRRGIADRAASRRGAVARIPWWVARFSSARAAASRSS